MNSTCQNCKKEYQPKRKGGRFCSVSCRVSAWEKAQQPGEAGWVYQGEEVYLARKLEAFMRGAGAVLVEAEGSPAEEAAELMRAFLDASKWGLGNSVVENVLKNVGKAFIPKES